MKTAILSTILLAAMMMTGCQQGPPKALTLDLGNKVTMKLVLIPAGRFLMGSPDDENGRTKAEGPQHEVTISKPFYMGIYDVTQEQFEQVIGKNPSHFTGAKNPVETVSWDDAVEFCKVVSEKAAKPVRLPTEAEWEYACRAGSKTRFCFGDDDDRLGEFAWYDGNSGKTTYPVGQKKPNAFGLYDMHGNVEEWCSDWYSDYVNEPAKDPEGPKTGTYRVTRGGIFVNGPHGCRSAYRDALEPGNRNLYLGFRVVVSCSGLD